MAPDGEEYRLTSKNFVALHTTGSVQLARLTVRNIPGRWLFVASPEEKEDRISDLSDLADIKLGETELPPIRMTNSLRRTTDRIYILDSSLTAGKISFGTFQAGKEHYSKIDITMPKKLSELPKAPTMIFLIDSSISQTRSLLSHQLSLVNSITSHTDDEDVILISYNRKAKRIEFSNDRLEETLSGLKAIRLENGSDIGAALALAGEYMKQIPNEKPVLVYAMTDLLFRAGMTQEYLMPKISNFKANATLHIIEVWEDENTDGFQMERDDDIDISGLSRKTEGVSVVASFPEEETNDLGESTLYLVRPTQVEKIQLTGFGQLDTLKESETTFKADWEIVGRDAVLAGELWSKPFQMKTRATPKSNLQTMRYALNESPSDSKLGYEIAKRAGVVSEFTSLVKDGKTVPEERLKSFGAGYLMGMHWSGSVGCGGVRIGRRTRKKVKPDYSSFFSAVAQTCNKNHPDNGAFRTSFETTGNEIVDVGEGQSAYDKCIVEGVWDEHLTDEVKTGKYELVFDGPTVLHI